MAAHRKITADLLAGELLFTASRSSGPGGQNVNKVNSKVTLQFDVKNSQLLSPGEKLLIAEKLPSRLTRDGVLMVSSQDNRSQIQNKEAAILKFEKMLARAFEKKKPRKATKPSKSAAQRRINKKKQHSEKKKWRQKPL